MTYASLLSSEGIESQYLVVIKPRRLASVTWTLVSGTKYKQSFSFGEIVALSDDGTSQTQASSSSLSDGIWYHDTSDDFLYIDIGSNPALSDIVYTYELYFGTFDAHFYRDPLDNSTRVVYFEPLITKSPQISQSSTDDLFGVLPTVTTSITISNTTQFIQEHVYESSFNNAEIKIYHYLDELTVANTKLVAKGFCGNVNYRENETSIEVFDNRALFEKEFRHNIGLSFFATSALAGLDPDFEGKPIRKVYGVVDKFIPVNIDYNASNASSTNNRDWICTNPHNNLGSITATVPASPSSTVTRTYLASANGIVVGDSVKLNFTSGTYYRIVTAVNKTGSHYIEHATVGGANQAQTNDTVYRSFISKVTILRNGFAPLVLLYGQDYTEYTDSTNKLCGFTLVDNFEASYSGSGEIFQSNSNSPYLQTTDVVFCRIYGHTNQETLSASPFGSNSTTTGTLTQAIVILYSLLKNNLSLSESQIDTGTFTTLQSTVTDEIGFAIPRKNGEDFPRYKEIISDILQTILIKFLIDDDNLYSLSVTAPMGAYTKSIEDDEILSDSFEYLFDYKDIISDVIVEYEPKEISATNQSGNVFYSKVTSTSNLATRLHDVTKQKSFQSLHFIESEAQTLADHLAFALGDRRGRIKFKTKNRFFDSQINDVVRISRDRQPGFSFVDGTNQNRDGVIVSAFKGLNEIVIEIDDQKGIEDNSGSW